MASPHAQVAGNIFSRRRELALRITEAHLQRHPEFVTRFGEAGRARCLEDADFHLQYLGHALQLATPALFVAYIQWARQMLEKRGISWRDLQTNLELVREELTLSMEPGESAVVSDYIAEALNAGPADSASFLTGGMREPLARAYLTALLRAERRTASALIQSAAAEGVTIRDLYLHVFQPVQREIGRLWQDNVITVAEEHYCTASTQSIMAQFYPQILATPRTGRKVVVACVGNELHEIGTRMIADFFEMDGWDGIYLGANTPAIALVDLVCRERPDLVALGVTMTYHLGTATELIQQLRADERCRSVKILAGGYVFQNHETLWRSLGVDGCARDAAEAVTVGNELIHASGA